MTDQLSIVEQSYTRIHEFLYEPNNLANIAATVPLAVASHPAARKLEAVRAARIAMTQIRKNPGLAKCSSTSIMTAVCECMALNLRPEGVSGQAYFVPYKGECQLQVGYRGMLDLARRSGHVIFESPVVVWEADTFSYERGTSSFIRHTPGDPSARGKVTHVYTIAYEMRQGFKQQLFDVMCRWEIDAIRAKSKAFQNNKGPWMNADGTDWCEQAKKTDVRRFCKSLPVSVELQAVVTRDELIERGMVSNSGTKFTEAAGESVIDPDQDAKREIFDRIKAWWEASGTAERLAFSTEWDVDGPDAMQDWTVAALENVAAAMLRSAPVVQDAKVQA